MNGNHVGAGATDPATFPPGPYVVTGPNGYLNQIGIGRDTGPNGHVDPIGVAYGAGKQVEAIAYLFAAAPDLLELAKQYAMECASCDGQGTVNRQIGGDGYGGHCAALADVEADCQDCADIRAVIARAEGR